MKRELFITEDGSSSLKVPDLNETYHSKFGAIQESKYVFIDQGLSTFSQNEVRIFEMGFGTGLNALLSLKFAIDHQVKITYHTIEKYPLDPSEYSALNYAQLVNLPESDFLALHDSPWGKEVALHPFFSLQKEHGDIQQYIPKESVDLIYYDAFGPEIQPDLWDLSIFQSLYHMLSDNGVLVTYSAKGEVRRQLKAAGFMVTRIPGPPMKRHMTKCFKTSPND